MQMRPAGHQTASARTGFTVWFTGLSGAGKTTLAQALEKLLHGDGHPLPFSNIDGDVVRESLTSDLGFL